MPEHEKEADEPLERLKKRWPGQHAPEPEPLRTPTWGIYNNPGSSISHLVGFGGAVEAFFGQTNVGAFRKGTHVAVKLHGESVRVLIGEWRDAGQVELLGVPAAEESLERQAHQDPDALLLTLRSTATDDATLAFAAQAAAGMEDSNTAVEALLPLLDHKSSVVREAVIGGLAGHLWAVAGVRDVIRRVAHADLSPAVRKAAQEAVASL